MYTAPRGDAAGIVPLREIDGLTVRRLESRDVPRLNEFLNHYIIHTAINFATEPFTLEERGEWCARFLPAGRHQMFVAEGGGVVLGMASTGQFRPKQAYQTTVEVSVVVAPEAVGFRIGQRLYETLFDAVRGEDIHMAIAAITLPNAGSCALHERFGFERVAVLREIGRKFDRYWDVAWYQRTFR